jgi:hypothetical protein
VSAAEGHGYRHCEWLDERPDGCVCYVQDDLWTKPAGGCGVHVPLLIGQGPLPSLWGNPAVADALTALTADKIREIDRLMPPHPGPPTATEIQAKLDGWLRDIKQFAPAKVLVCTPAGWADIRAQLAVRYPDMVPTQTPLLFGIPVYIDLYPLAEPWELVDAEEYYARVRGTQAEADGRSDIPSTES